MLRRSAGASAEGNLLGQREPRRPAIVLRREQEVRRGAHHGVSPGVRAEDQYRSHLQYIWAANAAQGWPGRAGLHRSSAQRRTVDDLRRRLANAQLLLRFGPGARL